MKISILTLIFCLFSSCYTNNGQKAIAIGKNYIFDKYNLEAEYTNNYFIHSFGNNEFYPGNRDKFSGDNNGSHYTFYNIGFSTINGNKISFRVLVSFDFTYIVDNYNINRFLNYSENYFQSIIEGIWIKSSMNVLIYDQKYSDYIFNPPVEYDESMDLEDMKNYIDFWFYISPHCDLNDTNKEEESIKIYEIIEIIKERNFKPVYIKFFYQAQKNNVATLIELTNWDTILNNQEIIEMINDSLKRKEMLIERINRNLKN